MTDIKGNLRRHALARRDLVSHAEAHQAAQAIARQGVALVESLTQGAKPVVSAYWPIRSELNTRPLLDALFAKGFPLALPVMEAVRRPLLFRTFEPGDELEKGPYGLSEPPAEKPSIEPDIVFAPLAAFDRRGYRLGYGGGIYDATLSSLRAHRRVIAIGLAYSFQEAEAIPTEPHDQKLDGFVTERETISFG
jgi:5-formyltetrahydrofolate cyclo-ligase